MLAFLWLFSTLGYLWFLVEKRGVPMAFAPLLLFACQTLIVWLAGLISILTAASYALVALGAALGIWMLAARSRALLNGNLLAFIALCALLWLRYRGALLLQYDDFSHWGLMARHLLTAGALPDASAQLITFQSYPPASACWIAYVCRFAGDSDGLMLTAQAWLTLAALWPLTVTITKPRLSYALAVGLPMLAVLSMFQGTASLMVDNLLAALAIGCAAIMAAKQPDARRSYRLCAPMLAVLALTKDGGLFFVAVLWALLLALGAGRGERKRMLLPVAAPVAARALWWVHIKLAYPAAGLTKHAMSLDNMRAMGSDKSYADIADIGKRVLAEAAQPNNPVLWVFVGMVAVCALSWLPLRPKERGGPRKAALWLLLGSVATYVAYLVSLWGMYTFSMNLEAAKALVAFERYNSTCVLFLYGMLALYLLVQTCHIAGRKRLIAAVCCTALLLLPFGQPSWRAGVPRLFAENYFVPMREEMLALYRQRPLAEDETGAVYIGERSEAFAYAAYMARYQWQRHDIRLLTAADVGASPPGDVVYALADDDALRAALQAAPSAVRVVRLP